MGGATHQAEQVLSSVLIQLIVMIAAARLLNTVFRKLGQPGVIGEIVAGLVLGPSLLGHVFPGLAAALFGARPPQAITIISQIGLTLLMFQIGADFEFSRMREGRARRAAPLIALVSVAVPFGLGLALGRLSAPALAPTIDPIRYSLFLGVGLAITAVPILGRILRQYGLTRMELGVVAISAAALNDVVGWVMLAGVSAYAGGRFSGGGMALQVGAILVFGVIAWFGLRPLIGRLIARFPIRDGEVAPNLMAIIFCVIFAFGVATNRLGIFTIFGGFAAGLLVHSHVVFVEAWRRQVGQMVLIFFLPVFFTYTGLRTNILGLNSLADLEWLALILAAAILGKCVPVYLAGRISGFDPARSCILATLMNTRALMELIVLNIGLDMGFLPQKVFTMLVIMAVLTTLMAGPLLTVLLPRIGHVAPREVEA
ncbi:MAG: cation:proton antiporter [Caulobacteraceae bacterium]|jgi:Kef-type K+ transport system membrane component KefB